MFLFITSEPRKPATITRPKSVAITPKRTPLAPHNANTTGHNTYRWSFLRSLAGDTPDVRRHPDSMRLNFYIYTHIHVLDVSLRSMKCIVVK